MIIVLFEVKLRSKASQDYLDIAAELRPLLAQVPGFISVERFQSLNNPDKLLSLSRWQDENAVLHWRTLLAHRQAQKTGREQLVKDYTITVSQVLRSYALSERQHAPADSLLFHL